MNAAPQQMFRVTTARLEPKGERNPFLVRDVFGSAGVTRYRTYEFPAQNEEECRRHFEEAQREGLEEVKGFHITKIERMAVERGGA